MPVRTRAWALAVLYLAVLLVHVVLPEGAALRAATGGSAGPWLILGGIAVLVWLYRVWLQSLRRKATPTGSDAMPQDRTDAELERNARHIVLREIGGPGQRKLKNARVLVIGAGGLGSPVLSYLAACGVGTIGVIDDDVVDNSNLQRQIIHNDADIGTPKAFSAQAAMQAQNPFVTVLPYNRRLTEDIATDLFNDFDLIIDGCDNFDTRYLVNKTAVACSKPLISGAISQWEGQVSTFDPANDAPCYACVFPTEPAPGLAPACAEAGVLGPLPGVIGSMMAAEAVKEIAGAGQGLRGRLLVYDALYAEVRVISVKRRADCAVCSGVSRG
jgi:molybdopterin/thiamine biosynthesis adenylyltransferase